MDAKPRKGKTPAAGKFGPNLLESYESIVALEAEIFTGKVEFVRNGITKGQLSALKELLDLDWVTLSKLLSISDRTIHLKEDDDLLGQNVCDRAFAVAEVFSLGYNIFRDRKLLHEWMHRRNAALADCRPIDLLDTIVGMEEVRNELRRLRYGMY